MITHEETCYILQDQSISSKVGRDTAYHPSPNFHPLKSSGEIQSPLSMCSPMFPKSSLFRSPLSELTVLEKTLLGKRNKRFENRARLDIEDEGPSSSSKAAKLSVTENGFPEERTHISGVLVRRSDSGVADIHRKSNIYANLPLLDRLAPHEDSLRYLRTDNINGTRANEIDLKSGLESRERSRFVDARKAYKVIPCESSSHGIAPGIREGEYYKPTSCFYSDTGNNVLSTNEVEKVAYCSAPKMNRSNSNHIVTLDIDGPLKQSHKDDYPKKSALSKDIKSDTGYEDTAHLTLIAATLLKMATRE